MTIPHDQSSLPKFARPSGANSIRLRLASIYFVVTGVWTILAICWALVAGASAKPGLAVAVKESPLGYFLGPGLRILFGVAWIWTGVLLARRSRRGGILAVVLLVLPLVAVAASVRPPSTLFLVLSVFGLLLVASVWKELG